MVCALGARGVHAVPEIVGYTAKFGLPGWVEMYLLEATVLEKGIPLIFGLHGATAFVFVLAETV